jgi:hypothetical protein
MVTDRWKRESIATSGNGVGRVRLPPPPSTHLSQISPSTYWQGRKSQLSLSPFIVGLSGSYKQHHDNPIRDKKWILKIQNHLKGGKITERKLPRNVAPGNSGAFLTFWYFTRKSGFRARYRPYLIQHYEVSKSTL